MGLLKHLLFWPVTGPSFLMRFSLDRVAGVVREELTDDTRIKAELLELQLMVELGDIDDAEYLAREGALMEELREVRQWREEYGMGVAGGVVRVQDAAASVEPDASAEVVDEAAARAAAAEEEEDRAPRVADPGGGASIELNLDRD
jgi:hypothetical protein